MIAGFDEDIDLVLAAMTSEMADARLGRLRTRERGQGQERDEASEEGSDRGDHKRAFRVPGSPSAASSKGSVKVHLAHALAEAGIITRRQPWTWTQPPGRRDAGRGYDPVRQK